MMEEAFRLIDDPAGESTYLRLSTRSIAQAERADDSWQNGALKGGYWLKPPDSTAEAAIVAMGALMPGGVGRLGGTQHRHSRPRPAQRHLARPAHRGWTAAQADRWNGQRDASHIEQLLSELAPGAWPCHAVRCRTGSLSWLGGVAGQRVAPLGVERFGQTGSLNDLYAAYRLDGAAITEALAEILLP
jgi:pyruvate dehydrogenase E1 component